MKTEIPIPYPLYIAYLPISALLLLQSWVWPQNWDDVHRAFNGIDPTHDLFGYGLEQSQSMLKLLIHDPALSLTNKFDYLYPMLSGIFEVALLVSFMVICTSLALKANDKILAIILVLNFNFLTGIQATTFLPPAAYPIAFSLFFLLTVLGNLRFDCGRQGQVENSKSLMGALVSIFLIMGEQIAFVFYACNYFQSFLFWLFSLVQLLTSSLKRGNACSVGMHFLTGARYLPFAVATIIWRIYHNTGDAESISPDLSFFKLVTGVIRWSLGGTSAGGIGGMNPPYQTPNNLPAAILIASLLYGAITLYLARSIVSKQKTLTSRNHNIGQTSMTLLKLAISILMGWSLPALSNRYFHELLESQTPTYVASRYAGLGLIILISLFANWLIRDIHFKRTAIAGSAAMLSLMLVTQNIQALTEFDKSSSLSKQDICSGKAHWKSHFLDEEVFKPGVNTKNWLTSFPGSALNKSLEEKRKIAINIFTENSISICH